MPIGIIFGRALINDSLEDLEAKMEESTITQIERM
jgi:hypothetical protein